MTNQHPITPPPELVEQWYQDGTEDVVEYVATQAARWGADQELEACFDFVYDKYEGLAEKMHATRRPKSPSLKEQALKQLECVDGILRNQGMIKTDIIRRALEALPDG